MTTYVELQPMSVASDLFIEYREWLINNMDGRNWYWTTANCRVTGLELGTEGDVIMFRLRFAI